MILRRVSRSPNFKVSSVISRSSPSIEPITSTLALEKPSPDDDKQEAEDNAQTIRPGRSPGSRTIPLAQPPAADIGPIVEDYSDLASEEDEEKLQEKVADFKVNN